MSLKNNTDYHGLKSLFSSVPLCRCVKYFLHCSLFIVHCSLFLLSCPNSPHNSLPPGHGSITLHLGGVSRAILPDTPALSYFDSFTLTFTTTDGEDRGSLTFNTAPPPVVLVAGTYTVTVEAHKDGVLTATGSETGIGINAGSNTPCTVTLTLLKTGTGQGTFEWDINFDATIDMISAHMDILDNVYNTHIYYKNDPSNDKPKDSYPLDAGIYTVRFTMIGYDPSDNDKEYMIQWYEILEIYPGLTSKYEKTFNISYFHRLSWVVTFNYMYKDDDEILIKGKQSYLHGEIIKENPSHPDKWDFCGWYTDEDYSSANYYDMPVHSDMELYAMWKPKLTINAELEYEDDLTVTVNGVTLSADKNITITKNPDGSISPLTVVIAIAGSYTDISWKFGTVEVGTSSTYTINKDIEIVQTMGIKILTVTATNGSRPYNATVFVVVSEP